MSPHLEQDKIWIRTLKFNLSSLSSYNISRRLKINWKSTLSSLHSCDSLNPCETLISGFWVPSFPTGLNCTKQTSPTPDPRAPPLPRQVKQTGRFLRASHRFKITKDALRLGQLEVFLAIVLICIFTVIQTLTSDPHARLLKQPCSVYPLCNVCAFVEILQKQMEEVCQSNGWTINPVPCR